ncbi:MAG: helix-turn-helix domain-containing protein [Alteromonadaceae bacterium]|nr:helix-turn-helix domain-containing protein [Alteromonadaceae bacterium]
MHKVNEVLAAFGRLIQASRAIDMDQQELALRAGVGRNTVSSAENGKSVRADALFSMLEQLDLLDDVHDLVSSKLDSLPRQLSRKARTTHSELESDF